MTSPHTPLAVTDKWEGKSKLNSYADCVMRTDAVAGRILDTLDRSNVGINTNRTTTIVSVSVFP